MEERIVRFIAALRAGGVRVSLAESADAFRAVEHLGVEERDAFRLNLLSRPPRLSERSSRIQKLLCASKRPLSTCLVRHPRFRPHE